VIKESCSIPWNAHAIAQISHPPALKLSSKTYSQFTACCGPDQQWDLATDIRITALICSPRHSVILWQNPPPHWLRAQSPLQSAEPVGDGCRLSAAALSNDFIPEPRRSKSRLLQQFLKPIKLLRLFNIFIKCSIYFTFFFFFSFQLSFLCLQFFTVVKDRDWKLRPLGSPCCASVCLSGYL